MCVWLKFHEYNDFRPARYFSFPEGDTTRRTHHTCPRKLIRPLWFFYGCDTFPLHSFSSEWGPECKRYMSLSTLSVPSVSDDTDRFIGRLRVKPLLLFPYGALFPDVATRAVFTSVVASAEFSIEASKRLINSFVCCTFFTGHCFGRLVDVHSLIYYP